MDWWTVASIVLVIVLFIVSTILVLKLAKRKKPVWAYKSKKVIGLGTNPPRELKLTFGGNPVNDVYQTSFILFNDGNEAIRKDDVTEKVTLHFKGAKILRQPIIERKSSEAIKLSARHVLKDAEDCVELDFLYLDHKDGAVVEVMHTRSEEITCTANIIGAKKVTNYGEFEQSRQRFLGVWISLSLLPPIAFVAYFVIAFLGYTGPGWKEYLEEHRFLYFPFVIFGALAGFSYGVLVNYVPQYLRSRKFPDWSRKIPVPTKEPD